MTPPLVPPIKCQGIKTKLVPDIRALARDRIYDRWVEPFCGSCVVAFNIQPKRALLCDTNVHIIRFYRDIQTRALSAALVKEYLREQGALLVAGGEDYFYQVRERFNAAPTSLDFLFLNRSCFNGVMRFNRRGAFNVPFCRKPERFSPAYITKIVNQVAAAWSVIARNDWEFRVSSFAETFVAICQDDLVYVDPPYAGRHVDYFNTWTEEDEHGLGAELLNLRCQFVLSTWHSNEFRSNPSIESRWNQPKFRIFTKEHFYHVGSIEELRHPMMEALITNFAALPMPVEAVAQQGKLALSGD